MKIKNLLVLMLISLSIKMEPQTKTNLKSWENKRKLEKLVSEMYCFCFDKVANVKSLLTHLV